MPSRGGRNRRFGGGGRPRPREARQPAVQIAFERRSIPQPAAPVQLISPGTPGHSADLWELVCRDGWEWRQMAPGLVAVRVAALEDDQAQVVQDWLERLKAPAVWWAISRELNSPGTSPEVGDALARAPWLAQVLPVLLEASTEGAPPPPPE